MAVTLTSTTQSEEEMSAALTDPRYGLEIETPESPEPGEKKPDETPDTPPAEGKTEAAPEAVVPTQEEETEEEKQERLSDEERRQPLPRGVQRKIDRLTRQRGEEKGRREALEARAADLEAKLAAAVKPPDPAPAPAPVPPVAEVKPAAPEPKPKPKVEDFPDSYEDYVEALVDWKADQKVAAVVAEADKKIAGLETKLAEARTVEQKQEVENDIWAAKIDQAKAKIPTFEADMNSEEAKSMQVPPIVQSAIAESDLGPQVGHYLLKHPDDAKRIFEAVTLKSDASQVDIRKAFRKVGFEIGRIEDLLNTDAPPTPTPEKPKPVQQPPVSKAPPPITPVGTRSASSASAEPPANPTDYLRWREEQLRKRA